MQDYRNWTAAGVGEAIETYGRRHEAGETFTVSDVVLDDARLSR